MHLKFKKISPHFLTFLLIVIGVFLIGSTASAAGEWAAEIITWISQGILWILNFILVLVIYVLVFVASIQNFIDAPAVALGWVIVRDICNMFFVVVLLVIAFGTILNIPNYSYKKWLPKLILFAILINFSKTICGLMIDVAQVVMLTFVNAFATIGGGNIITMLGIEDIVTLSETGSATEWSVAGAYVLGVIYVLVALVVIFTMTMILVMRLVMIWVYVVLSPAAYLLAAFPGGQKYASQWWSEFIKNLVVGPVLAFFIWLSLAALGTSNVVDDLTVYDQAASQDNSINQSFAPSKGSSPAALIKFIVAIGMLVGGLMVAQQIGGAAGSMAGKGMAALQKGKGLAIGATVGAGAGLLKWGGRRAADVRDIASESVGVDLNLAAAWRRRNEQSEANRQLRLQRIRKETLATAAGDKKGDGTRPGWLHRKLALASTGDVAWQNLVDKKHRILTAGSPKKMEEMLNNIRAGEEVKEEKQEDIDFVRNAQARTITQKEYQENASRARDLSHVNQKLMDEKKELEEDDGYKKLSKKEKDRQLLSEDESKELAKKQSMIDTINANIEANKAEIENLSGVGISIDQLPENLTKAQTLRENNKQLEERKKNLIEKNNYEKLDKLEKEGVISDKDQAKLDSLRLAIENIDEKIKKNNEERQKLANSYILVKDKEEKKQVDKKLRANISEKSKDLAELENQIKKFSDALRKNKLSELDTSRTHVDAVMEAEATKKIATITNPDQLVGIFKEAAESKDHGLMAAAYKKLAKTYNYNELHRELNLGTGYEGMVEMAKYLQTNEGGGMSEQDARALIAEIGEIAKGIGHFEAFGTMVMNKAGQWEQNSHENQEAAILSEKSKIQVQQFVRNINRLGAGAYKTGKPHTSDNWELSNSTVALYASKDAQYANEMEKTGNINMIQFIGANPANIEKLKRAGAKQVAKLIEDIMRKATSNVANPVETIRKVSHV